MESSQTGSVASTSSNSGKIFINAPPLSALDVSRALVQQYHQQQFDHIVAASQANRRQAIPDSQAALRQALTVRALGKSGIY